MKKILIPVDGSDNSLRAVRFVIGQMADAPAAMEAHLLNVQPPVITGDVKMFVGQEAINAYYHDEAIKALGPARAAFDAAQIPYVYHIGIGHVAETIAAYAREKECTQIVMGARGLGSLAGLLLGSVTAKVVHLAEVPVTLVK
jgi:nucleotide-binding universal stress UspA family protein